MGVETAAGVGGAGEQEVGVGVIERAAAGVGAIGVRATRVEAAEGGEEAGRKHRRWRSWSGGSRSRSSTC